MNCSRGCTERLNAENLRALIPGSGGEKITIGLLLSFGGGDISGTHGGCVLFT